MAYTRITVSPDVMGGAPCIRGPRVPVDTVVAMVGDGMSAEAILTDLPYLEGDDIAEHCTTPPRRSENVSYRS